jgi:hypothetical protein
VRPIGPEDPQFPRSPVGDPKTARRTDLNALNPVKLSRSGGIGATKTEDRQRVDFREDPRGVRADGDAYSRTVRDRDRALPLSLTRCEPKSQVDE